MTWVDLVVLAGLAVSALLGLLRGFVREVLGVAAWVGAAAAAVWVHPMALAQVQAWLPQDPILAGLLAYGAAFLAALIVLLILTHLISRGVHRIGLGSLDHTLGLLFGLVRGAVLVVLAYILAQMVVPIEQWPPAVQAARTLPFAYQGAAWAAGLLPEDLRPRIAAPPTEPPPSVDSLLRAVPGGMALGSATGAAPDRNQETR